MKITHVVKVFLLLFVSTAFIFSFTYFGVKAYDDFFKEEGLFAENTKVGTYDIAGKTRQQAERMLQGAAEQWKKGTAITFVFKERSYQIDNSIFQFNISETLTSATAGKANGMVVIVDRQALAEQMKDTSYSLNPDAYNVTRLQQELTSKASQLDGGKQTYQLEDFLLDQSGQDKALSKADIHSPSDNKELASFVKAVPALTIKGKSTFSLEKALKDSGTDAYSPKTLNMIASAVYGAILPTNFTILERNISASLPSYAKLGYEAKVSPKDRLDLVFANKNASSYTLAFSYRQGFLSVMLKGSPLLYRYSVIGKEQQFFEPKTIVQYDSSLPAGLTKVKKPGQKGQMIKIFREIYDESGSAIKKELISEDFYPPVPAIELRSLSVPAVKADETAGQNEAEENDEESDPAVDEKQADDDRLKETEQEEKTTADSKEDNGQKPDDSKDAKK
ncbi:G5 domain-containing protein [Bacillus testis]|uniref:G5 domain-containing protein n=1 Tax=Bacillus testis TaxID=1622072 RepID=UPI00067E899D|nr:G5 domain-containing protein [Bacillus testis]